MIPNVVFGIFIMYCQPIAAGGSKYYQLRKPWHQELEHPPINYHQVGIPRRKP